MIRGSSSGQIFMELMRCSFRRRTMSWGWHVHLGCRRGIQFPPALPFPSSLEPTPVSLCGKKSRETLQNVRFALLSHFGDDIRPDHMVSIQPPLDTNIWEYRNTANLTAFQSMRKYPEVSLFVQHADQRSSCSCVTEIFQQQWHGTRAEARLTSPQFDGVSKEISNLKGWSSSSRTQDQVHIEHLNQTTAYVHLNTSR
jgi:hypothetical protein